MSLTHTLEYYSATQKKEVLPFTTAWTNLEGITLSEVNQKSDKQCMISHIRGI